MEMREFHAVDSPDAMLRLVTTIHQGRPPNQKPHAVVAAAPMRGTVQARLESHQDKIESPPFLIGVLFGRPESELMKRSLAPHIPYFHHRSGKNFHMLCAGYRISPPGYVSAPPDMCNPFKWSFSNRKFNKLRIWFERETIWQYSGEVDLLMMNSRFYPETEKASLDFSSAVSCRLDELVKTRLIATIESFLEDICRAADQGDIQNPVRAVSRDLALHESRSAVKRLVLSLIPRGIGDDLNAISRFAVRDIRRKGN